jgi:hypothetical protein
MALSSDTTGSEYGFGPLKIARGRANGTSACWLPSPSYRPASLRRSSMAPRLRTSRSLASPPCPIPGSSRSRGSSLKIPSLSNSWAKEPIEAVDSGRRCRKTLRELSTAEPVSAPPKWKLENGKQRPAPETLAQRTKMPEIAGQRPADTRRSRPVRSERKTAVRRSKNRPMARGPRATLAAPPGY